MFKRNQEGKRKLIIFEVTFKGGRYYVLNGILIFLEKIEDTELKNLTIKPEGQETIMIPEFDAYLRMALNLICI